jgi:hypothetical protein
MMGILTVQPVWKLYEDLMGNKTPIIIIDSIGIDSRKKKPNYQDP